MNIGVSCAGIRRFVTLSLQQTRPKRILDLGCGNGMYAWMIRKYLPEHTWVCGVDGYLPYLNGENGSLYNVQVRADVFDVVEGRLAVPVDCVLCMDVIEHFEREKAMRLQEWLIKQPLAYLSTPLFWFEQDAAGGNVLEIHKSGFSFEEITGWGWKPIAKVRWDERGWIGAFKNV